MDSNGLNPWTVKQFNLVWLEIIQWFGVVWIFNMEGWIGLGGFDLYCIVEVDWWGFRLDPGPLAGRYGVREK